MLDEAGVDGAILVSAFTMYRYDASYAVEVRNRYPNRFALVKPVDPANPSVAEVIAQWKCTPGAVGVAHAAPSQRTCRGRGRSGPQSRAQGGRAFVDAGQPAHRRAARPGIELIRRNPDTQIVVDHLGLVQPHAPPKPAAPWAELPKVLTLAKLPHVAIKITGACTLSLEPFPYYDIWDPVCRMIDAFGIDRCMWGTDWTRAVNFLTYAQGVDAFRVTNRISASDKAKLMGGTLTRTYGWAPG